MKKLITVSIALLVSLSFIKGQTYERGSFTVSDNTRTYPASDNRPAATMAIECDTLRYPLPGEILYYILLAPDTGYVTGNNNFNDKAKAEYFGSFEAGTTISGLIADFAVAKNSSNPQVTFAIWNNQGTNGKPGAIIATATKPLSSIVADVNGQHFTTVTFNEPCTVTGPFYAGVILPTDPGDTLALWCRSHVAGYNGTAWDLWSDDEWHAFNDVVSWGENLQTTMTVFPIACKTVGMNNLTDPEVSVNPNPATGVINITTWKSQANIELQVFTMSGQKVYARSYPGSFSNFNIDLSFLQKGVYMLRLSDGERQHNQKLVLE
ncbi:MAG: T9SS type A sorting domain-containing protein [Bacteroidota bacterium]